MSQFFKNIQSFFETYFFLILSLVFVFQFSQASINYHGRIISQSNNQPLTSSNVRFNIKLKVGSTCVVYEENHDNIDMTSSNGYFNLNIGEGTAVFGSLTNALKIDNSVVSCLDSNTVIMSPIISKSIDVQILEYDGFSYVTNIAQINGLQIKDVPVSVSARNLEGKTANQFIQVSGAVTQNSLNDLVTGTSSLYVQSANLASDISPYISGKMDKSANLSDVSNIATARSNLGLGSIATLNTIADSYISSLSYSKLTGLPTSFTPAAHSHSISDITGLQSALDNKITNSQFSLNCTAAQTIQYISVSDSYQCQSISISNSQVSGLGSLATLNSVSDSNITDLSGSKLTGGVKVGSVSGTTCSNAGLVRYNSGSLELCNGSIWASVSGSNSPILAAAYGNPAAVTPLQKIIFPSEYIDPLNIYNPVTGVFTIPSAGYYKLTSVLTGAAPSGLTLYMYVNNLQQIEMGAVNTSVIGTVATAVFYLNQNDLVDMRPNNNYDPIGSTIVLEKLSGSGSLVAGDITAALGYTPIAPANNLSDLTNISTARTNLGLGSVATLNTISDTNITSLSGTKLTGGIQVGSVSGTSCTTAGLLRYNASNLEICNGTNWGAITSSGGTNSVLSDWIAYTPTVNGFTGNVSEGFFYRRNGDSLEIKGSIAVGTNNGTVVSISLPSGLSIDTTKNPTTTDSSSHGYVFNLSSAGSYAGVGSGPFVLFSDTSVANNLLYIANANSSSRFAKILSSTLGSSIRLRIEASGIPISGWTASVGSTAYYSNLTATDVITALNYTPQNAAKLSLNCTASQTVQYISITDSYQCQSILVSDSNISSLAGSKLTGGVQIGTVAGTTCTSAGLTRYNSGNLEYCNGSSWVLLSSYASSAVPVLSGWTQYTLPITATTTNPTKGTVVTDKAYWRRVGDTMEIMYSYEQSAGGSAGSGTYIFPIPSGYTIDTAKSVAGVPQQGVVGHFSANGGAQFTQIWGEVKIHNSTGFSLHGSNEASRYIVSSGSGDLGQASIKYSFFASVPIVGWSATANLTVNNPVIVIAQNSSGQSIPQNVQTIITNWSELKDSSNSFNPATGIFTAPSAGDYEFNALITFGDTIAAGDRIINIRNITTSDNVAENLRPYTTAGSGQVSQPISFTLSLNQGDQVAITGTHGATSNQSIVGVPRRNTLTIKKIGF